MRAVIFFLLISLIYFSCKKKEQVYFNPDIQKKSYLTYLKPEGILLSGKVIFNLKKDTTSISHYINGKPTGKWFVIYGQDTVVFRHYYDLFDSVNNVSRFKFEWIDVYEEKFSKSEDEGDLLLETFNSPEFINLTKADSTAPSQEFLFFESLIKKTNKILDNKYSVGFVHHYEGDIKLFWTRLQIKPSLRCHE
ncbi:hypothetical protein [Echinicola shivajiensis]|uniref:hypothetical protein n=1 Tax=Echinicola shivajiensis TaxID=1035916 RepID=UPI001BFC645E|nr:hypothetical protein [Echinicola shivajiensis]